MRATSLSTLGLGALLAVLIPALACCSDVEPRVVDSPQRIVALAPAITETLFELGFGDRVIGVGDFAKYPPEVAMLPRLGGLFDARLETIAALRPDLAILLPSEESLGLQLKQLEIEVMTVRSESLEDIEAMAVSISDRLGSPEAGQQFLLRWRQRLAPTALEQPVLVLLPVARQIGRVADIVIAGPGTFLDELLVKSGVQNVMSDSKLAYPQVGLEEIIARRPDVILELQPSPGIYEDLIVDWRSFDGSEILEETCVRVIAGDHVLIPGPRVPRLYDEIRQALRSCLEAT